MEQFSDIVEIANQNIAYSSGKFLTQTLKNTLQRSQVEIVRFWKRKEDNIILVLKNYEIALAVHDAIDNLTMLNPILNGNSIEIGVDQIEVLKKEKIIFRRINLALDVDSLIIYKQIDDTENFINLHAYLFDSNSIHGILTTSLITEEFFRIEKSILSKYDESNDSIRSKCYEIFKDVKNRKEKIAFEKKNINFGIFNPAKNSNNEHKAKIEKVENTLDENFCFQQ